MQGNINNNIKRKLHHKKIVVKKKYSKKLLNHESFKHIQKIQQI